MPTNNTENISLGIGTVEFGAYNANGTFGAYRDIGAVKASCNLQITREVLGFETGRPLLTVLQSTIRESVEFRFTMAELTIANIKQALGTGTLTSGTIPTFLDGSQQAPYGDTTPGKSAVVSGELLEFGGLTGHTFIGLRFTHLKDNGKREIFEGYKASPMGTLALPFNEADWNLHEASFKLLADTTKVAGKQYFQIFFEQ